jgi:hypothetical protein
MSDLAMLSLVVAATPTFAPDVRHVREATLQPGPWTAYLVLHVDCGIDAWVDQPRYDAACRVLATRCARIFGALGVQDFEFQGTSHGLGSGEGFWEWLTFGSVAFQIGIPWPDPCSPSYVRAAIDRLEAEVRLALQAVDGDEGEYGPTSREDHDGLFFVATCAAA